jgi:hypothetical protein
MRCRVFVTGCFWRVWHGAVVEIQHLLIVDPDRGHELVAWEPDTVHAQHDRFSPTSPPGIRRC